MTNYEKIKNMSVEEMASNILKSSKILECDFCNYKFKPCKGHKCVEEIRTYLESEVTEE